MTDAEIIAQAEAAALSLQAAIVAWEAAHPSPMMARAHKLLSLAQAMASDATGGAFKGPVMPDGGTNKPPS